MTTHHSSAIHVAAPPDAVFALLTDLDRLPDWNAALRGVPVRPALLEPGAEWVVTVAAMGTSWPSRARAQEVDRVRHRFTHRSWRDGSEASSTIWRWAVDAEPDGGSRVTVGWDLVPAGPLHRMLLFPMRRAGLAREVRASLTALAALVVEPAT